MGIQNELQNTNKQISQRSNISGAAGAKPAIPATISVRFSVRKWIFDLLLYTKDLSFKVNLVSRPADVSQAAQQAKLNELQRSLDMIVAITESIKKAKDFLPKYSK